MEFCAFFGTIRGCTTGSCRYTTGSDLGISTVLILKPDILSLGLQAVSIRSFPSLSIRRSNGLGQFVTFTFTLCTNNVLLSVGSHVCVHANEVLCALRLLKLEVEPLEKSIVLSVRHIE